MHNDSNYWIRRLNSSRLSRRRFVGGAAVAGVGAAGFTLVGCGDDDDDTGGDDTGATPTTAPGETPAATATEATSGPQPGGTRRASSANNTYDTFDADRSRFTPFAAILGRTNLGIVHYRSFANAETEGGFAESWEQPDGQTIVFKLRPGLKWHNKAPVNGRDATVEDMKFFIERNKAGTTMDGTTDPNFYRSAEYASVASVEATDATTLTVKFDKPNPFFLGTLSGGYSKVQAPEAVEAFENDYQNLRADLIIGTGAFTLDEFKAEGSYTLSRNPDFYNEVMFDKQDFLPLFTDAAAQQAAFEQKQIDEFGPRSVDVLNDLLARFDGQIYSSPAFSANPMAGTYFGGAEPWSNQNLIGAIFRTIDRRLLIQQLFQGSGALSGNVPPTQAAFGISESELIQLPGYLEDHAKDLAEAKAMWEAGGGPALGAITIDIPDIWEGAFSGVSASITGMLKANLGNEFVAKVEPYSTITNKIVTAQYGNGSANIWYGWISDVTKLEPTLDLWQTYNSAAPQFAAYAVKIDEVDALTSQAVLELDIEKRKELTKQVNKLLVENYGAGIPYNMIQINNTLRWNYYHINESPPFVNSHNEYRDYWFDQADPTWEGRQA